MLYFLRNNTFLNRIFRNILRFSLSRNSSIFNKYRVSGIFTVMVEDLKFRLFSKCDDHLANRLYYGLDWEDNELRLFKSLVAKARTIIDIGANTGIYSIFASKINHKAQIYSFEPHPSNLNRLNINVALNKSGNIHTIPIALGDRQTELNFTIPADDSISDVSSAVNSFAKKLYNIPFKEIKVQQDTLDGYVSANNLKDIDVIKLDVEYYEYNVLMGSTETIKKFSPDILCEVLLYENLVKENPEFANSIPQDHALKIEQFFKNLGYNFYFIDNKGIAKVNSLQHNSKVRNFLFTKKEFDKTALSYREVESAYRK